MRELAADLVLVAHFAIAVFIAGGIVLTWAGALAGWRWVRNRPFRLLHLAAIVFVAAESLLGIACPLTIWEDALRLETTQQSFVARWISRLLYYDLPQWVFTMVYVAAALATAAAWWLVPPQRRPQP